MIIQYIPLISLIVLPLCALIVFCLMPMSSKDKKFQINKALWLVSDYYNFYDTVLVSSIKAYRHARFDLLDTVYEDETNIDKLYKEYAVPILELYDFSYTFKTVDARNEFRVARMKPMYDELIQKINEMYETACICDEELLKKALKAE